MSAPDTALAIRRHVESGDLTWGWRSLLQGRDHLWEVLRRGDEALLGAWEAAPQSTGAADWDALLAALTDHEYQAVGRDTPAWAVLTPLETPAQPPHPFLSEDRVREQTPEWLKRLNIFVPARDLVTA